MKITIDTKEDSPEEIRNIIKMLSSLVGEKEPTGSQNDLFSQDSSPQDSTGFVDMFGNSNLEAKENPETETKPKEELDLDIPGLEEY